MKIITQIDPGLTQNKKDFYDFAFAQSTNTEDEVFIRRVSEISLPVNLSEIKKLGLESLITSNRSLPNYSKIWCTSSPHPITIQPIILVFCGKVIPIIRVQETIRKQSLIEFENLANTKESYIYQLSEFEKYKEDIEKDAYYNKFNKYITFFQLANTDVPVTAHIALKSPYFMVTNDKHNEVITIITNPHLQTLEFPKIMHPYSCHQTIRTFLFNNMVEEPKINPTTGSDEVLIQSKGFDKYSFRKPPGKKKAKGVI